MPDSNRVRRVELQERLDELEAEERRRLQARDRRDAPIYERLIDGAVRELTDFVIHRAEDFAVRSDTHLSCTRKAPGGLSIYRSAFPEATLDIALERFAKRLVCRSWFTPERGRTYSGASHAAQIVVSDDGSRLIFLEEGRALTLDDVERQWLRAFLSRLPAPVRVHRQY